jgi:hypothetical protein
MEKTHIMIFIILLVVGCASNKMPTNLDSLSEKKRNAYLKNVSKDVVLKYGQEYYRNYKEPVILRGQVPQKGEINTTGEDAGRYFYHIAHQYDDTKELLEYPFLTRVQIWEDTGQPSSIFFGTGLGRIIPENYDWRNDNTIEQTPYHQRDISPIYDFWSGKEIDIKTTDPVNKEELIICGFERQPDGNWIKVKPDVPPKY